MSETRRAEAAARRYYRLLRARGRAAATLTAVTDGVALGLLDRAALAEVDRLFYDRTREPLPDGGEADYADDAWNGQGLFAWEERVADAHLPAGARVLVTGAGGGREVLGLRRRGLDAVGYEPHPGLRAAGARLLAAEGHPGTLRAVARDAFPDDPGPYDAVVVGWGSYMLVPGRARRTAFLRRARAVVPDGAPLLLSFWPRSQVPARPRVTHAVAGALRRARGAEPVELGDLLAPNFVHAFTRPEVEAELSASGWALLDYRERPVGHAVGRAGRA